ncbi:hypothetical protein SAMN05216489_00068 [Streptomyces sp. 3213]|uniref:hypothetical protein n=1 Tax=Streptomyces sp. 3213.3 TaxID=1855348 RepID=UPI00089A99BB|nr:hypothetical protein [Streptomyces sp. 3213.3]SEC17213.1 hypothetical protein SAMN05216489_00068 [Streptomyces sp. 3213] [Streptomyces sp. 3213.3]
MTELELVIYTYDATGVDMVVDRLKDLNTERLDRGRVVDPMSIVVVTGAVVTLVNSLLELKEHLAHGRSQSDSPASPPTEIVIIVRNENGDAVRLDEADRQHLQQIADGEESQDDEAPPIDGANS